MLTVGLAEKNITLFVIRFIAAVFSLFSILVGLLPLLSPDSAVGLLPLLSPGLL